MARKTYPIPVASATRSHLARIIKIGEFGQHEWGEIEEVEFPEGTILILQCKSGENYYGHVAGIKRSEIRKVGTTGDAREVDVDTIDLKDQEEYIVRLRHRLKGPIIFFE